MMRAQSATKRQQNMITSILEGGHEEIWYLLGSSNDATVR